ncbi:MAG: tRNA (uridine(54)-C5)-methyltransferase TrmA [Cellvibrionaceae bacterium]|nr:tRNA (uridine(54)-C5)-methyltransferase TrmA [Cellvibrionaceae bacterium]
MHYFEPGTAYPQYYHQQFQDKIALFLRRFERFDLPELDFYPSSPSHYRMRAEFRIWKDAEAKYVMFKPEEPKKPIEIKDFSIGSIYIHRLMPQLLDAINSCDVLKNHLFQVEFLCASNGEIVTTLIYRKKLEPPWQRRASELAQQLGSHIIGRSKGQKIVLDQDYVMQDFAVAGKQFSYQQVETSFSQPNAEVCEKMLGWAHRVSEHIEPQSDLLELYCGNANFTLPLSLNFRSVLATEVSKSSVRSARFNIELNKLHNIDILRMSSEEFTQALNGDREFRRLKDIDLKQYRFSTIFVDPPRAGLDTHTQQLVQTFDNIIYVSCNPESLASNLDTLCTSHQIAKLALFDQFPYTPHLECGVYLRKRQPK